MRQPKDKCSIPWIKKDFAQFENGQGNLQIKINQNCL